MVAQSQKKKEYMLAWRAANKERIKVSQKRYYEEHSERLKRLVREAYWSVDPDIRKSQRRDYYVANREMFLECSKKWQKANKEYLQEYQTEYRKNNRLVLRQRAALWRAKHPDRALASKRSWNSRNFERVKEFQAAYHEKNKKKANFASKLWRTLNPEAKLAYDHLRRAIERNSGGKYTKQDVTRIFSAQKGKCAYCKIRLSSGYHIDHIIPISRGGTNWPKNIQITCSNCNMKKHASDPLDFARKLGNLL